MQKNKIECVCVLTYDAKRFYTNDKQQRSVQNSNKIVTEFTGLPVVILLWQGQYFYQFIAGFTNVYWHILLLERANVSNNDAERNSVL